MVKYCYYIALLVLALAAMAAMPVMAITSLQAQVDKNPALLGEAVTLTITADARLNSDALNYQALQQDFRVMMPAVSQSTQVINGQTSHRTSWSFTLFPSSTGIFRIPAFTIQGIHSTPIELTVIDQPVAQSSREVFLTAALEGSSSLYVQQLFYYQVVIHFNGDLQRGNLTEPQLDGAEILRVGQDSEGTALVDGVRYRTITRRYAIIPQRSGALVITPPVFTGEMLVRDTGRSSFFGRSKTVMAETESLPLEIKPQPAHFPGNWLVAGLITLTEEWQPEQPILTVGEPVTRIITLSAIDVASNQLPTLTPQLPASVRIYQDQPQSRSAERAGRLVAQSTLTTALIATQEGELILPEITLPWWNSQTNQLEYAVLPSRTLQVQPGQQSQTATVTPALPTLETVQQVGAWQWNHLSTLLSICWVLSLLILWLGFTRRQQVSATPDTEKSKHKFRSEALKRACLQHHAHDAQKALLDWAKTEVGLNIRSLEQLAAHYPSADFSQAIRDLEQYLYRSDANHWNGAALYASWQQLAIQQQNVKQSALPSLYPG